MRSVVPFAIGINTSQYVEVFYFSMWFTIGLGILSALTCTKWHQLKEVKIQDHLIQLSEFRVALVKDLSNATLSDECGKWITSTKVWMNESPLYGALLNQSMYETGLYCLLSEAAIALQEDKDYSVELKDWLSQY